MAPMQYLTDAPASEPVPIWPVTKDGLKDWPPGRPAAEAAWVEATGFAAKPNRHLLIPTGDGRIAGVLAGVAEESDLWSFAGLPGSLPEGVYRIDAAMSPAAATDAALGWALGTYRFDRYKPADDRFATLVWPDGADRAAAASAAAAHALVRDLINTPTAGMGPGELADAAEQLAAKHGADSRVIVGDALLAENYPMVHAVGRASANAPRLIDLAWGDPAAPKVTLVGKGVCFDSGGLDLKPASGMALMKKDMGGAANVLGLAAMVMTAGLPIRLRVMIPAVENAVSGNAFRPGDVLKSRKGLTVEIGNTDAEGRLVLADALAEAASEQPELLIDMATLTGAARVALGTELAGMFTDDDGLAADLSRHSAARADPLWRLPLWAPYRKLIDSEIADINNAGQGRFGGAVTAALFLKEFAEGAKSWAHFDIFGWNDKARPGRPIGGEAFAIRALYGLIAERYNTGT